MMAGILRENTLYCAVCAMVAIAAAVGLLSFVN
jgi:hypothetical protein